MDILILMTKDHEGQTVARMGSHFKMPINNLKRVMDYIVPMLEDALTRTMAKPQGLAAILAQLASGQYQRDLQAEDFFENSRILANGTGVLSLLLRNEATMRVISFVAAEGSKVDAAIIRRMMPFIATIYISALAKRSNEPLRELAERFTNTAPETGRGTYKLAQLVLSKSPRQIKPKNNSFIRGSIKSMINNLAKIEREEEAVSHNGK